MAPASSPSKPSVIAEAHTWQLSEGFCSLLILMASGNTGPFSGFLTVMTFILFIVTSSGQQMGKLSQN